MSVQLPKRHLSHSPLRDSNQSTNTAFRSKEEDLAGKFGVPTHILTLSLNSLASAVSLVSAKEIIKQLNVIEMLALNCLGSDVLANTCKLLRVKFIKDPRQSVLYEDYTTVVELVLEAIHKAQPGKVSQTYRIFGSALLLAVIFLSRKRLYTG